MRKAFIFSLGVLLTSHAYAADAVVEEVPVVASFDWSGFYVGLQAGYLASEFDITFPGNPEFATKPDNDGFVGGIYGGYNYQFSNNWVIGAEGEFNGASADGDDVVTSNGGPIPSEVWDSEINWTAAIRGRIGYAMDRTLIYAAGGVAFADYDVHVSDSGVLRDTISDTPTGWTIGAGAEHAFAENIVARVDYRYSDFGSETFVLPSTIDTEVDLVTHEVKFGIAYKF